MKQLTKKQIIIIISIIIVIISITFLLPKIKEYIYKQRLKNATILVETKEDLTIPFNSEIYISDNILNINGKLVEDKLIDTTKLGIQTINFEYINDENLQIPYSYQINVVDNIPPVIWLNSTYSVLTTYEGNLVDDIMCADNYDDTPICQIIGEYDTHQAGSYNLTFEATDSSGNKTTKQFKLNVKEPSTKTENNTTKSEPIRTNLVDVIADYKNDNTKIGIDVSRWQGDIDFVAVKEAGVEFVFIKVGGTKGIDGEYYVDAKFKQNIEGFNKVGIPVGIYIYTYAKTPKNAKDDALWVLDQIKDYKVDLPIVYDWENWSFYNEFNLSFYNLTNNAKIFLDTIKENGYEGALYSSKNYLEKVWLEIDDEIWLAHYTKETNYQGDYKYWQLCDNGLVNGINANVDIDIMYIK